MVQTTGYRGSKYFEEFTKALEFVDKHGQAKPVIQMKMQIKEFERIIFYHEFDKVLGTGNVVNLSVTLVGATLENTGKYSHNCPGR